MSDNRIVEVINRIYALSMSASTVIAMTEKCAEMVAPAIGPIADAVATSPIVHCDEIGTSAVVDVATVESKGSENGRKEPAIELVSRIVWIHGASNQLFTCLHRSRILGYERMTGVCVLPRVKGTMVHDCWPLYWMFKGLKGGLCNAHILRELNGMTENTENDRLSRFVTMLILRKGTKGKEDEICLFIRDINILFDNNLAERAFRFVKEDEGLRMLPFSQMSAAVSRYRCT